VGKQGKAGQATDGNIILRMRFACSMANTYINDTYTTLTVFPQLQFLRERAKILQYKYTVSLVINFSVISPLRVFRRGKRCD